MAFTRTTTINAAPGGDSTKQAVLDLDTDLTGAFTHLNTLDTTKLASATAGTTYAPIAKGVTNGDSHDHSGGDGAQIAYSSLSGTPNPADYAPAAKGVTNGDSHDHSGGDGGQIAYSSLSGIDGDKGDITVSGSGATWTVNDGDITLAKLARVGTAGQVLTSGGAGADPSYQDAAKAFCNKIVNGGMAVDQLNLGAAQTITAGAALAYTVDQWYAYCTGANVTGQRVAGSGQSQYRYRFTGAASVTKIGFAQRIEADNCYDLNGQIATLSVDLANSLLTTVTWTAWYANTNNTFGTLASPTRTPIATGTFTVNSTVARYNVQINVPSAATTGIEIEFSVGAQTSGTWTIGDVQLELGATATAFERPPLTTTLLSCKKYLQIYKHDGFGRSAPRIQGYANAGGVNMTTCFALQVEMLYAPVWTVVGTWALVNTLTQPQLGASHANSIEVYVTSTAAGMVDAYQDSSGDGIILKAQL